MKLPSGKEISDEVLRDIADSWVTMGFIEEHAVDIEDAVIDELLDGTYGGQQFDDTDTEAIIEAIRDVVTDTEGELKDKYSELYIKYIASKHFEDPAAGPGAIEKELGSIPEKE
jgi:hypothetical protein